ncbi:MAG: Holliday junction resolvase RuvX [Bacteroidales bacterium]|jgi:putative Holliday junction resolvase|nr:Holliday junction resolvase RuvX [Bacteroidales bacterium]
MGRILAIDYGQKRTGLAVTDPLKIIATALTTVQTKDVLQFIADYLKREEVETIVVGEPKQMNGKPSESSRYIEPFVKKLREIYPKIKIERADERFTSKIAFQTMIDAGITKKARRNKATIDKISAVLILQNYLEKINYE